MDIKRCGTHVFAAALLLATLIGCASQQRSQYPVLKPVLASDAKLDCPALDDEILKANAIRDAIYEEHGDVVGGAIAGTALQLAIDPLSGIISGVFGIPATSKASKHYITAAAAAEVRIENLLVRKQETTCPDGAIVDPELSESKILVRLQEEKQLLEKNEISPQQYAARRRKLLDALR